MPWDVTVIDRTTAAVTLLDEKMIQLISVTDGLSTTRSIRVRGECYGITGVDSKLAVTCDPNSGHASVKVLSMDGKVLQSITTDRDGQRLQVPRYITSTPGGAGDPAKLYVTDCDTNIVLCYTLDGRCVFQYRGRDLSFPRGIAVDVENNMYVACSGTRTILQVSADDKKGRVLLDRQKFVDRLFGLCYEPRQDRLVVTQYNTNTVTVYRLV
jgi:hypothetical protein